MEEIRQTQDISQPEVVRTTTTETTAPVNSDVVQTNRAALQLMRIVYFITGTIATLLAFRFALQLLGASRASGFVDFMYNITEPLVRPFYGAFQTDPTYGVSRLDLETLLAIVVYLFLGWGIASLIRIAMK